MPVSLNDLKEHFSKAYVRAVGAAAGFVVDQPSDYNSADLQIGAPGYGSTIRAPKLELQVKCTGDQLTDPHTVKYDLRIKNYEDLREPDVLVKRILVVVFVPQRRTRWLQHSEDNLLLRHCGYWRSLYGEPSTTNRATVTVSIPRTNQFTVDALRGIMDRLGRSQLP